MIREIPCLVAVLGIAAATATVSAQPPLIVQKAARYASAPVDEARFGQSVTMDGDTMLVGAPHMVPVNEHGVVYRFDNTSGAPWAETSQITPSDPQDYADFGAWV